MTSPVDAPIVAVTVYPGQARITRRGLVTLAAGQQQVIIGRLPLSIRPDSVRVSGRGPATVLGVDVLAERNPRAPDAVIADLEQRELALQARFGELMDADSVQGSRADLLGRLAQRSGGAFARALAVGSADPGQVSTVADALTDQLATVFARRRELAEQRRVVQEDIDELSRTLQDRLVQQAPDRMAIAADLDVTAQAGAELELEVSYLVDDARWESRYDIRLRDDTLTLTWFGLITQNTGEDWPECDLALSTARPASTVAVPELDPWYLDVFRPVATRSRVADAAGWDLEYAATAAPSGMAQPAMVEPPAMPMGEAQASTEQGVAATTYRPSRRVAVPTDGTAHRTTVTVAELPARLDHVTVPLRGPEAYLRATVTNSTEHTLRPGRASIFHGNEFVGTTMLEPWAPGEEVELTLGIDERIRVERELTRRSASKAVLGGTRRREIEYRIEVGNYGPTAARITVIDQVPVSRHESIVVRDLQLSPKPAEQNDLGELTWQLQLPPGDQTTISVGFRVDISKGVDVAGWRD